MTLYAYVTTAVITLEEKFLVHMGPWYEGAMQLCLNAWSVSCIKLCLVTAFVFLRRPESLIPSNSRRRAKWE